MKALILTILMPLGKEFDFVLERNQGLKNNIYFKIIISAFFVSVFSFTLFHIYGNVAWKSNVALIILYIILCILEPIGNWLDFAKQHKVYIVLTDILVSFCLIGNYLFCYPLDKSVGLISFFEFLVFSVVCTPIVVGIAHLPQRQKLQNFLISKKNTNKKIWRVHLMLYISIPIIAGIVSIVALNPCIVSYDAYYVMAEAKGLIPVDEYIGIPYVLLFRLVLSVIDSVTFLCAIQIVLYAVVIGYFLAYIEKLFNIKFEILFAAFFVFTILPNNTMMLITLTKDVYYAIFLCLLLISLLKIREAESIRNYFWCGLSLFLIWSIRQSGILAVIIVIAAGLIFVRNKKRMIIAGIISVAFSFLFNYGLVVLTSAEKTPGGLKYVSLYQDILGVYYSGGNMSDETMQLVELGVGDTPEFNEEYTPYWAKYDYYQKIENVEVPLFIKCYIDTFLYNPVKMLRSILCRLDMMWDIRPGVNAVESWQWRVKNSGGKYTYLVEERNANLLTKIYDYVGEKSKDLPYKDVMWRVAIWNLIFILLLNNIKDKRDHFVFLPFYGFILAYAVTLGWSHYRYYWADELLVFMGCVFIFAQTAQRKKEGSVSSNG